MPDDVVLNAAVGTFTAATDKIGGVDYQRVKPTVGDDGTAVDVSAANPMPVTEDTGTLVQRAELIVMLLRQLLSGAGGQPPDGVGRMRVSVDNFSATLAAVTTVSAVTTVATVTNLSRLGTGAYPTDLVALSQSNAAALALRDRIIVT